MASSNRTIQVIFGSMQSIILLGLRTVTRLYTKSFGLSCLGITLNCSILRSSVLTWSRNATWTFLGVCMTGVTVCQFWCSAFQEDHQVLWKHLNTISVGFSSTSPCLQSVRSVTLLVLIHRVNLYWSNEKFCMLVRVFIVCWVWFQTIFCKMINPIMTTITSFSGCRSCIVHVSFSIITIWPPISTIRPLIYSFLFCMFCMFTIILQAGLFFTYWLIYRCYCLLFTTLKGFKLFCTHFLGRKHIDCFRQCQILFSDTLHHQYHTLFCLWVICHL